MRTQQCLILNHPDYMSPVQHSESCIVYIHFHGFDFGQFLQVDELKCTNKTCSKIHYRTLTLGADVAKLYLSRLNSKTLKNFYEDK